MGNVAFIMAKQNDITHTMVDMIIIPYLVFDVIR